MESGAHPSLGMDVIRMTPGCPEPDRPRTDEMNARLLPCRKRMIHANRQRRQSVFDRYPQPLPFRGEPARRDRTVSRCPDTTAHTLVHRLPSGVVQRSQDRFECREKTQAGRQNRAEKRPRRNVPVVRDRMPVLAPVYGEAKYGAMPPDRRDRFGLPSVRNRWPGRHP